MKSIYTPVNRIDSGKISSIYKYNVEQDKQDLLKQLDSIERVVADIRDRVEENGINGLEGWSLVAEANGVNFLVVRIAKHGLRRG